jgi:hypothetical protein
MSAAYALGSNGYPPARGYVLDPASAAKSANGNGTGFNTPGAVGASQYLYGALHVLSVSASDSIEVYIESDDNVNFTSATARISFASKSAIGYEFTRVAGPITDTYWRARWVVTGAAVSILIAVSLAIL